MKLNLLATPYQPKLLHTSLVGTRQEEIRGILCFVQIYIVGVIKIHTVGDSRAQNKHIIGFEIHGIHYGVEYLAEVIIYVYRCGLVRSGICTIMSSLLIECNIIYGYNTIGDN